MGGLTINTGTGPEVATDLVGTDNYQIVKVMQGAVGTTAGIFSGGIFSTAHASRFQGFAIATTSAAAGVVVVTSGAYTLYITDVLMSVTGPTNVQLCSATTALAQLYFAANGGWAQSFVEPIKCNSNQSIVVILSSSGACGVNVQGYTVT